MLVIAALLVVAAPAEAKAQALYQEGAAAYQAGKFDDALGDFMAAYDTAPIAGLLFNIGQCHRQLKHHELAVEYFERYLHDDADAPNKLEVVDLVNEEKALAGPKPTVSMLPVAPAAAHPAEPELWQSPLFWGVAGGAVLIVLVGGTVAVVVATAPAPAQPKGTLGTFDLRSLEVAP